ncbi:MAG TPA: glycosyltransferase family 2 protein [Polyangiales bacterium]|nr:glycosyltransferase family 2 protein [Polyangiales bacterium]
MLDQRPNISVFFPVYRDERTVRTVTEKALAVLREVANQYEVVIIDDGSPDRAGEIADELAREYPEVSVVHHEKNMGYGVAIREGLARCRYEWICFTDGDDEYDIFDLRKLIALKDYYDLIITFRYVKVYSGDRQFISWVYNMTLRALFRTSYRDISTGLRLIRKSLADQLNCESNSPFIGAEITIKSMLKGYRIGEVGIQTFPREFGKGASTSPKNIKATIVDMVSVYRKIFSPEYELPENRTRS